MAEEYVKYHLGRGFESLQFYRSLQAPMKVMVYKRAEKYTNIWNSVFFCDILRISHEYSSIPING